MTVDLIPAAIVLAATLVVLAAIKRWGPHDPPAPRKALPWDEHEGEE